jgi:hypothetical protein
MIEAASRIRQILCRLCVTPVSQFTSVALML